MLGFIAFYLYRKLARTATAGLLAALFILPAAAQRPEHPQPQMDEGSQAQRDAHKHDKRGPRAIGVVEFLPGGGMRLVPIALWIDDRFYDASLYQANPEPMAVQPQTLYQAFDDGEPTGWFTVTSPKQINGNWVADGTWKAQTSLFDQKLAQQAAEAKPKKRADPLDDDTGPPVLKRAPSSEGDDKSSSGSSSPAAKPAPAPDRNAPPASASDDPDRPTLKNSSPKLDDASSRPAADKSAAPTPASTPSSDEGDPDRPVLKRGAQPAKLAQPANAASPVTSAKAGGKPGAAKQSRAYPAISDNSDYQPHPMLFAMSAGEREEKAQQMIALAMQDVRKFATTRKAPLLAKGATITDYDLRAFDLDFSNSPTLVLTGKLPVAATKPPRTGEFDYYVTVVARLDIQGVPQKIFSSVTDSNFLDAFPRLELIDAVDADANGRGDLLFRQYSDGGVSYGLYRVYAYSLRKVFEGGAGL